MSAATKTIHLLFDENTIASFVALAGVAGKTIAVKAFKLFSAGTVSVEIRSDANLLAGPYALAAGESADSSGMAWGSEFFFETNDGEDLVINLSAAIRVTGWLVVEQS